MRRQLGAPIPEDHEFSLPAEKDLRHHQNEWLFDLLSLPGSYVLRRIGHHLAVNTMISVLVTASYQRWGVLSIPTMLGHTLTGGFLSLLLIFRQNTAYTRFYEACDIWSRCMTTCRSLAVDVVADIRPHDPATAATLLTLITAFPDALAHTCKSGTYPLPYNVRKLVIPRAGISELNPAVILCLMMQEALHEMPTDSNTIWTSPAKVSTTSKISDHVDSLMSSVSSCERIVRIPVLWKYSRHVTRFLTLWSGTLPFSLVSRLGWLTVPVVTALWCLIGIKEIGHMIEQPFVGYSKRRTRMAYDTGLPVFVLSKQARLEIEEIISLQQSAN